MGQAQPPNSLRPRAEVADYPEAPSGLIYASSANRPPEPGRDENGNSIPEQAEARRNFYRSCQIYQAPYEIESIINVALAANGQIVELPAAPSARNVRGNSVGEDHADSSTPEFGTTPNSSVEAMLNEPYEPTRTRSVQYPTSGRRARTVRGCQGIRRPSPVHHVGPALGLSFSEGVLVKRFRRSMPTSQRTIRRRRMWTPELC